MISRIPAPQPLGAARKAARRWAVAGCVAAVAVAAGVVAGDAQAASQLVEDTAAAPADSIPVVGAEAVAWRRHSLLPIPVLFYTPETRWGAGAAALHSYRSGPEGRPAVSAANVVYTQNRQMAAEFQTTSYLREERFVMSGAVGHTEFPDVFFGIGNATLAEDEEGYTSRVTRVELDVRRRVAPGMYFGVLYQLRNAVMVDRVEGGWLADGGMPGSDGGVVSGAGGVGMWDTRDNILYPTTGSFHTASIFRSGGVLGGDFQMTRYSVDLRRYLTVRAGHVLGAQAILRSVAGDVPFDMLPRLGGQNIMRGTFQGRYRDRHLVAAQTEYRAHIWRQLGLAAFAGAGQVASELDAISLSDLHYSLGLGFRFMIDPRERMNLRVDLGFGREGTRGVYITVGESF
jgi:hypothetical protein